MAWVLFATLAHAQPALQLFLVELDRAFTAAIGQQWLRAFDIPVIVSIGGIRVPFQDAQALLDRYEEIFPHLNSAT